MYPKLELCATASGLLIIRRWNNEQLQSQDLLTAEDIRGQSYYDPPGIEIERLEVCGGS